MKLLLLLLLLLLLPEAGVGGHDLSEASDTTTTLRQGTCVRVYAASTLDCLQISYMLVKCSQYGSIRMFRRQRRDGVLYY